MKKVDRSLYEKIFSLVDRQKWLRDNEQALFDLIDLCDDVSDQEIITNLLSNFIYLDSGKITSCLREIVDTCINIWGLSQDNTQLVAFAHDSRADSSQVVLQFLKPLFAGRGWTDLVTVNRVDRIKKSIQTHANVVLVDEFSGTGNTVVNRVNSVRRNIEEFARAKGLSIVPNIYVALIAAMECAFDKIKSLGINYFAATKLKRGLTDYIQPEHLRAHVKRMVLLENKLQLIDGDKMLPRLGFGKAQALYCAESMNTPNSVFPIFWWKRLASGEIRKTLLTRG